MTRKQFDKWFKENRSNGWWVTWKDIYAAYCYGAGCDYKVLTGNEDAELTAYLKDKNKYGGTLGETDAYNAYVFGTKISNMAVVLVNHEMTKEQVLTNFDTFVNLVDGCLHLSVATVMLGVPKEYETGFDFELNYISTIHPDLDKEFLKKLFDTVEQAASDRLNNDITFETNEEYNRADFEEVRKAFGYESSR